MTDAIFAATCMRATAFATALCLGPAMACGNGLVAHSAPGQVGGDTAAAGQDANSQAAANGNFASAGDSAAKSDLIARYVLAGGCLGTLPRARALPGRIFVGLDGVTPKDPMDVLADAHFNAIRVETELGQCLGPSDFAADNADDPLGRERNFRLDFGCIDAQVAIAKEGVERGWRLVVTLNMGRDIPPAWVDYSYVQMLAAIDGEVRRQLQPFVAAGLQPDVILLENEGTDGFLFNVTLPSGQVHARGINDGQVSAAQLADELCGHLPTGNIVAYPQLAGYYKQQVHSARALMASAGMNDAVTRFGLHSHGQYFDYKLQVAYSTDPNAELRVEQEAAHCGFAGVIPDAILNQRADALLDILGVSGYPEPMVPSPPGDGDAQQATLGRMRTSLGVVEPIVARFGRATSGPYWGQWQKQMLVVEYATAFVAPADTPAQQTHTKLFFELLMGHEWFLGALWWEPTYAHNNWQGDQGSLYRAATGPGSVVAPLATVTTWGSYASPPRAISK